MNAELLARNIGAHWVQSGALVVACLTAMRRLRFRDPLLRLAALHLLLATTPLLPAIQPWRLIEADSSMAAGSTEQEPAYVPLFIAAGSKDPAFAQGSGGSRRSAKRGGGQDPLAGSEGQDPAYVPVSEVVIVVVIAGIAFRLLWLTCGIARLFRLRGQAREIAPPQIARDLESTLGVRARYFEQDEHVSPATFGFFRATVLLPSTFETLDGATQRAIICHELIHVRRRDAAVAFVEEMIIALLWFHPWLWVLRRRMRIEREHVVDGQVVDHLGDRAAYVRSLVEISGHDLVPHLSTGMSHVRELRTRIDAILEETAMTRNEIIVRLAASVMVAGAALSLAQWAVPLRAQGQVSAPSGQVVAVRAEPLLRRRPVKLPAIEYPADALEKRIAGLVVVNLTVDPSGQVTSGAVAGGPEELRASALKAAMGLTFEPHSGTTVLPVMVTYTIRSDSTGVHMSWGDSRGWRAVGLGGTPLPQDATVAVWQQDATRPGVRPPKKVKDVVPRYPAIARNARVQGAVVLEASVDRQGRVVNARVIESIPLLDEAARAAVLQWQYEPTVEDGTAVPRTLTVTINFGLQEEPTNR
jgi:TonB family protein